MKRSVQRHKKSDTDDIVCDASAGEIWDKWLVESSGSQSIDRRPLNRHEIVTKDSWSPPALKIDLGNNSVIFSHTMRQFKPKRKYVFE